MDWLLDLENITKIVGAYLLALPVGYTREKEAHSVGVRTFPLVAMASCGYVLLGSGFGPHTPDMTSRIIQGVVAGIGFVGAGAILKSENHVHGTATAASIWNIAAMGAAVALDHFLLAGMLALLNLIALRWLLPVKRIIDSSGPTEIARASIAKPGRGDSERTSDLE
jgi:putative Mg2+ transporter-C (MgtC) family protein